MFTGKITAHRVLVYFLPLFITSLGYSEQYFAPTHPSIRYHGRVDTSNDTVARFDWPGVIIEFMFEGTTCSIELGGNNEFFTVMIGSTVTTVIKTDRSMRRYTLAKGLPDTAHHISIMKRYETKDGIIECRGIYLDDGKELLPPPQRKKHLIEFIGASSILGYGNESTCTKCDSVEKFSNTHRAYGPIAATILDCEYSIVAKTRTGLVRNYSSPYITSLKPMAVYYSKTFIADTLTSKWMYDGRIPSVIVITLGINDYSTTPHPPRELFNNRYFSFTQELYERYPGVSIVCVSSWREPLRSNVEEFVQQEKENGNNRIAFFNYERIPEWKRGCDWHPTVAAHREIGEKLAEIIRPFLEK